MVRIYEEEECEEHAPAKSTSEIDTERAQLNDDNKHDQQPHPQPHDNDGDGWETASEGEGQGEGQGHGDDDDEQLPSVSGHAEDSYQDAMTEEENMQRALLQANDAKTEGNKCFASGNYEAALTHYAKALDIAPDHSLADEVRSMCYANRAICYYKMGMYEETVMESSKAVDLNPSYIKALIRRADGHEKLEHFEESIADWKKILDLDASNVQAMRNITRLEPLAAEKREKLKEEMIAKLKDLGNSVLGRFGMSVDNFQAVKDPNTGSYSISFQR